MQSQQPPALSAFVQTEPQAQRLDVREGCELQRGRIDAWSALVDPGGARY